MTAPSLFDTPTVNPTAPGDSQAGPEPGPVLDWQEQPERVCKVTGKPRPRFVWPVNYEAKQARNMGRKLDEYREKKAGDKRAPRLFDKTAEKGNETT